MECLTHKHGKKVRYYGTKEYFCVPDVVEILGLKKRHNYTGKTTKKIKAQSKNRGLKQMIFLHHTHMQWLIQKSNRPEKKKWLLKEACGIANATPSPSAASATPSSAATPSTAATASVIMDLWDNYLEDYKRKSIRRDTILWPRLAALCPELSLPPRYAFPYSIYDPEGIPSLYVQRRVPDNKLWLCLADLENLFEIYLHNKAALGIRKHTYERNFGSDTYERVTHEFIPAHHFGTVYSQKRGQDEDAYRAIMKLLADTPCKTCGKLIKTCE